ncbi:uroporphyrinogen decarboxylase family protein [Fructobacillus ficulneus]|uniref:Uroporphyrinogen-III decarboxylase n=1 Tax=Fructobacillus ficulneus TaxID=157463 RepID=A0A0K8MFC9_9LACO|nr:uroporphyrinogen decarboxylase family protein [Fructobacillus ficulneus]GAO99241.1 uroporphyrinogen-III decarboxylase [Fructobacillus ficulneus]
MSNNLLQKSAHTFQDFTPFSVWHHFIPNEHIVAENDETILATDIREEPLYVQEVDSDFIKLMNDGFFTYKFNNVSNPKNINDLKNIQELNQDDPWLVNQRKLIQGQLDGINSEKTIFSNVFSAITLFKWALVSDLGAESLPLGDKIFTDLYLENPAVVTHALEIINQDIKKQIKISSDAGVDGIFFSTQEIQDSRLDKEFFLNVQKRLDSELIEDINENFKTGILHICGFAGAKNRLTWFTDYNLPIINWATKFDGLSFREGQKLFKDKTIFGGLGNTTNDILYNGSQIEIETEIDRILDEVGTENVLIGADCTVPRDTPVEHILWARDAAHSYLSRKEKRA